jgi:hypothetical protein
MSYSSDPGQRDVHDDDNRVLWRGRGQLSRFVQQAWTKTPSGKATLCPSTILNRDATLLFIRIRSDRPGFSNRYKYFPVSGFCPGPECELSEENLTLFYCFNQKVVTVCKYRFSYI